jgi:hypothetical protein
MRAASIALVLTGLLASTSANAIILLNSQYEAGPGVGANTGVNAGDIVTVEAFYDPLFATLQYQDFVNVIHTFDAEHGGLRIAVGDLAWQITGPLSINTSVRRNEDGEVIATTITFLGYTNPPYEGALPTTLSTPWDDEITGLTAMWFTPQFHVSGWVEGPRLFDEQDMASILSPMTPYYVGGAYAETAEGLLHFNFSDPAALNPPASVPEPGSLGLLALGAAALLVGKRKTGARSAAGLSALMRKSA